VAYLAHEALIRSWPRAQQWLERETLLLRMRDELARDATVWDFHQRTDDWLAVSPEKLAAIWRIEQAGLTLSGVAADYAQRSRRRAARNRLIRFVAIAGICGLSVLASAAWLVATNNATSRAPRRRPPIEPRASWSRCSSWRTRARTAATP